MTGFIYNVDSKDVVAILHSNEQSKIEHVADSLNVDAETYALTYTPAFGFSDGLNDTDAPEYDLDNGETPKSL